MRALAIVLCACSAHAPELSLSTPQWTTRAPGLATADVDVVSNDKTIDSIALVRLDPNQFDLSVHVDAPKSIAAWQRTLGAEVVINGGYFEHDFTPTTPLRSAGHTLGPLAYSSDHGAIVIGGGVEIIDLRGRPVEPALASYHDAIVSYPLLVDGHGGTRAKGDLLASRQFIGIDGAGWVVIGTTRDAALSLHALGELLLRSPLDLRTALNLDGGPSATQLVKLRDWQRLAVSHSAPPEGIALPIVIVAKHR